MKTKAATREYHLNAAFTLDQEAEKLEACAEARCSIRNPGTAHPNYESVKNAARIGHASSIRAAMLRAHIQRHLIIVTELSDYSEPSDRADQTWAMNLQLQAEAARLASLTTVQVQAVMSNKAYREAARNAA